MMVMRRKIAILGATGSIGTQALDVVRRYPDRFEAVCLTARGSAQKLFALVRAFRPRVAALEEEPEAIPEDVRFCQWVFGKDSSARVEDVLRHPTWRMGAKITVDCATMLNKGLEVIEAHHLFGMDAQNISVLVHPESVVHSMVEFEDGAVLAQLGNPDMRGPIGYAMGFPERLPYEGERLSLARAGSLTFRAPDDRRFPCLSMAYEALGAGGSAPVVYNGANEVAVEGFLSGRVRFGEIARCVRAALDAVPCRAIHALEDVLEADLESRAFARKFLGGQR